MIRTLLDLRQVNNLDNEMHATYMLDFSQNSGIWFILLYYVVSPYNEMI